MRRYNRYLLLTWILMAGVMLYASYFTYANSFSKIAFTFPENDVVNVPDTLIDAVVVQDKKFLLELPINISHTNANYMRVETDGIAEDSAYLHFYGYDSNWNTILTITDYQLNNGFNDIRLPIQNFHYFDFFVIGPNDTVVKNIQFRESIKEIPYLEPLPFVAIVSSVIVVTTIAISFAFKKRYSDKKRETLRREQK